MRKIFCAVLAVIILFSFAGCEGKASLNGETPPAGSPTGTIDVPATNSDLPTDQLPSAEPSALPTPALEDSEAVVIYRSFLNDNYEGLSEACFGGIAGIGFVDLDNDGSREMVLFDAGASASMGVQFFDIIGGRVQCVSANMQPMGEAFGGDHFTDVYVNANLMEDFRLMEDNATGERFFLVESANGNTEFSYHELIRFGSDSGALTLTALTYKYEEYNDETGETTLARYRVSGGDADEAAYTAATDKLYSDSKDVGLECRGVFMWESPDYTDGFKGFMAMAEKALELGDQNKIT